MPIEGQNPQLRKLADDLAKEATGMTQTDAWAKGICVECKQPALPRCHTTAGRREYNISAMCEECFDALFADENTVTCEYCHKDTSREDAYHYEQHTYCSYECFGHDIGF